MEHDKCVCKSSGYCHRYQRLMSPKEHAICTGEPVEGIAPYVTPEKSLAFRRKWLMELAMIAGRDPTPDTGVMMPLPTKPKRASLVLNTGLRSVPQRNPYTPITYPSSPIRQPNQQPKTLHGYLSQRPFQEPPKTSKLRWAYGVTTIPRRFDTTLPTTLQSLHKAGFDRPTLFVDGYNTPQSLRANLSAKSPWLVDLDVVCRYDVIGAFGNWMLAILELFIRNPTADRYALFQDDLLSVRDLKYYLEETPFPQKGYVNLLTHQSNETYATDERKSTPGFFEARPLNPGDSWQAGRGALGLVFDRDGLIALFSNTHMLRHSIPDPKQPTRYLMSIDGGVVSAMNLAGYREYVHYPSLLFHTGMQSTIGPTHRYAPSKTFPGDEFSTLCWISPTPNQTV